MILLLLYLILLGIALFLNKRLGDLNEKLDNMSKEYEKELED